MSRRVGTADVQCETCGAISGHLRGCNQAPNRRLGIGQARRRTSIQARAYDRARTSAMWRDRWTCRVCGAQAAHAHHIETVQTVHARGAGFDEADRVDNLLAVCHACHAMIHSAAGIDMARAAGWIIDR